MPSARRIVRLGATSSGLNCFGFCPQTRSLPSDEGMTDIAVVMHNIEYFGCLRPYSNCIKPMALPPGRDRRGTKPDLSGHAVAAPPRSVMNSRRCMC
jgi:hypothetical protein